MGPSFNDDKKFHNMGWTISAQNAYENTIEKLSEYMEDHEH